VDILAVSNLLIAEGTESWRSVQGLLTEAERKLALRGFVG